MEIDSLIQQILVEYIQCSRYAVKQQYCIDKQN